jgi:hypothetical protein
MNECAARMMVDDRRGQGDFGEAQNRQQRCVSSDGKEVGGKEARKNLHDIHHFIGMLFIVRHFLVPDQVELPGGHLVGTASTSAA